MCYKGEEAEPEDPVEALKAAFDACNAKRYARALKKAREAGVDNSQIPTVYSLQMLGMKCLRSKTLRKVPETFKIPNPPSTSAGEKRVVRPQPVRPNHHLGPALLHPRLHRQHEGADRPSGDELQEQFNSTKLSPVVFVKSNT